MTNKNLASAIIDRAPIAHVTVDMTEGQLVRVPKKELEDLLASMTPVTYNFIIDLKEEETMKTTNPVTAPTTAPVISSAEFIEAMAVMARQYGWTLFTPKKEDGVIAKEGRQRVLELYWSNTKEKLGGFDLYMRNDLFQDITDLLNANGVTANLTVNPKWNMVNRYSFDRENTSLFLNALKAI